MLAPTAIKRPGRRAALNDMFKPDESAFKTVGTCDLVWHEIGVSQIATKNSTVESCGFHARVYQTAFSQHSLSGQLCGVTEGVQLGRVHSVWLGSRGIRIQQSGKCHLTTLEA